MRYERPVKREDGPKGFSVGTHAATIQKVIRKTSKSNNKMFMLKLAGNDGEQGVFFLTFGNDYTSNNLNYLLASIEDNGYEIPEIDFGYNKETFDFLQNKEVYIKVKEKMYKEELRPTVDTFLTLDEFERSEEDSFDEESHDQEDW